LIGLAIFLVLAFLFVTAQTRPAGEFAMPLSVFEAELAADNVERVDVEGDALVGKLRTQRTIENQPVLTFRTALPPGTTAGWNFMEWLLENRRNATVNVGNDNSLLLNILVPLIPWLLIFFFIWFFVFRQLRKAQSNAAQPMRVIVVNPTGEQQAQQQQQQQQQPAPTAPPFV
jgi:ATP-dependent Zn protease